MKRAMLIHGTCLSGLGLTIYAAWLAWPPLAYGLAGLLLCAFGMFVSSLEMKRDK